MTRRHKTAAAILILLALFLTAGATRVGLRMRQAILDDDLVLAVGIADVRGVHRLLEAGADPDAVGIDRPHRPLPLLWWLFRNPAGTLGGYSCIDRLMINDILSARRPADVARTDAITADLVRHGADVSADSSDVLGPMSWVSKGDLHQSVQAVIDAGADVNERQPEDERTPLFGCDTTTAALLLAHGAYANAQDKGGLTPLCKARTAAVAQLLIDHHANVNHVAPGSEDELPKSVLDLACTNDDLSPADQPAIVALLRAHGALTYAELKARSRVPARQTQESPPAPRSIHRSAP